MNNTSSAAAVDVLRDRRAARAPPARRCRPRARRDDEHAEHAIERWSSSTRCGRRYELVDARRTGAHTGRRRHRPIHPVLEDATVNLLTDRPARAARFGGAGRAVGRNLSPSSTESAAERHSVRHSEPHGTAAQGRPRAACRRCRHRRTLAGAGDARHERRYSTTARPTGGPRTRGRIGAGLAAAGDPAIRWQVCGTSRAPPGGRRRERRRVASQAGSQLLAADPTVAGGRAVQPEMDLHHVHVLLLQRLGLPAVTRGRSRGAGRSCRCTFRTAGSLSPVHRPPEACITAMLVSLLSLRLLRRTSRRRRPLASRPATGRRRLELSSCGTAHVTGRSIHRSAC